MKLSGKLGILIAASLMAACSTSATGKSVGGLMCHRR